MEPLCSHSEYEPSCKECQKSKVLPVFDQGAGVHQGPFADCRCKIHHVHGPRGQRGCPVCNPKGES